MTVRLVATRSCWLASAIALAVGSFATAQAQEATPQASVTYTVLHSFAGGPIDGSSPVTAVTPAGDGGYYGTTAAGFTHGSGSPTDGWGVVYKLAADGSETVVHSFDGNDGSNPEGAVILDERGNLYGTTAGGGSANRGIVYKLTPDGSETVLHTFFDLSPEGFEPIGRLVRDSQGNFYGTTALGGDLNCGGSGYGCGTVFKLTPNGTYTVLHTFAGVEGNSPNGSLIRDSSGNLYGTTKWGGPLNCDADNGCGTVFRIATNGTFTLLYAFTGGSDGAMPYAGLVGDADDNLYGTTLGGGGSTLCKNTSGCGTVFKLAPDGTETVLYAFQGGKDGAHPEAALYRNPQTGALFGTTANGGYSSSTTCRHVGCGTVFMIKPNGSKQTLLAFGPTHNGAYPEAALVKGQSGELIGTTLDDDHGYGAVYSLQMTQ